MTAVAKLVFGAAHDKARLTEYAAVLAWAAAEQVPAGALAERIAGFDGGIKGIVAAERAAPPSGGERDAAGIRCAPNCAAAPPSRGSQLDVAGDAEFVLLRRPPRGGRAGDRRRRWRTRSWSIARCRSAA